MVDIHFHTPPPLKGDRRTGRCCQRGLPFNHTHSSEHAKSKRNRHFIPASDHSSRNCPHAAAMARPLLVRSACRGCIDFGPTTGATNWTRRDRSGCSVRSRLFWENAERQEAYFRISVSCLVSQHSSLGCCAMACFVLSCDSAFGGMTEGSEKIQNTVNIADGGLHRHKGCTTHPAPFQKAEEPSKMNRAPTGRLSCARRVTT